MKIQGISMDIIQQIHFTRSPKKHIETQGEQMWHMNCHHHTNTRYHYYNKYEINPMNGSECSTQTKYEGHIPLNRCKGHISQAWNLLNKTLNRNQLLK